MPPHASTSGFELGSSLFHQQDRDAFISQIKQNQVVFAVSCWNTLIWWNWNVLPKLIGLNKTSGFLRWSCFLFLRPRTLCSLQRTVHVTVTWTCSTATPEMLCPSYCICPWRSYFSQFIHENVQNTSTISMWIKTKRKRNKWILVFDSFKEKAVIHTGLLQTAQTHP